MWQANPRWRTAAMLKSGKSYDISSTVLAIWWSFAWWCIWDLRNSSAVKINKIWKSKMVASCYFEKKL